MKLGDFRIGQHVHLQDGRQMTVVGWVRKSAHPANAEDTLECIPVTLMDSPTMSTISVPCSEVDRMFAVVEDYKLCRENGHGFMSLATIGQQSGGEL